MAQRAVSVPVTQKVTVLAEEKKALLPVVEEKKVVDEKKVASNKISNWMLALGIGLVVAVVATTTVYVVKSRRRRQLKDMNYLGIEEEETVESYSEKLNRYWAFTVTTFTAVRGLVSNVLVSDKKASPMVSSKNATVYGARTQDSEVETIITEQEL